MTQRDSIPDVVFFVVLGTDRAASAPVATDPDHGPEANTARAEVVHAHP